MPARPRQEFPQSVRKAALVRAGGQCEADLPRGERCPHRTEHPLAGRVVVPDSGFAHGESVYVVDWIERVPALAPAAGFDGIDGSGVVIRDRTGHRRIPADDLPAYDPQPIGFVS